MNISKNPKVYCILPFTGTFVGSNGTFRDCCATRPRTISTTESFDQWWQGQYMNSFRKSLYIDDNISPPASCSVCIREEKVNGTSMRKQGMVSIAAPSPKYWNISFGNICNLACWTCVPERSSTIMIHQKNNNILPTHFKDPNVSFEKQWPSIKSAIINSYSDHDIITLHLTGGEPFYNKDAIDFLLELKRCGLDVKTNINVTTNASHNLSHKLLDVMEFCQWHDSSITFSIDAIGDKAQWLRYGCNWATVDSNVKHLKQYFNNKQIHTTYSILNCGSDLIDVINYARSLDIKHNFIPVTIPEIMDIRSWDLAPELISDKHVLHEAGMVALFNTIGSAPVIDCHIKLKNYITSYKDRLSLEHVDKKLYNALFKN